MKIEKIKKIVTDPRFLRFLREVLAVVAGIILSLTAANIVEQHKRATNIKETISLVRDELKINFTRLQILDGVVQKNIAAYKFFHKNLFNVSAFKIDSIRRYLDDASAVERLKQERYAHEVLKNHSQFAEVDNDLLMCISETYDNCEIANDLVISHFLDNTTIIGHLYEYQTLNATNLNQGVLKMLFDESPAFKSRCLNPQQMDNVADMLHYTIGQLDRFIPALDSMICDGKFTDFTNHYTHDR